MHSIFNHAACGIYYSFLLGWLYTPSVKVKMDKNVSNNTKVSFLSLVNIIESHYSNIQYLNASITSICLFGGKLIVWCLLSCSFPFRIGSGPEESHQIFFFYTETNKC